MTLHWDYKKPGEPDDRDLDWSLRLDPGDTITGSTWAIVGNATSLTLSGSAFTPTRTKIVLNGGRDGSRYRLKNTITTAIGANPLIEYVEIDIKDQ